jgi:hypothetical protein
LHTGDHAQKTHRTPVAPLPQQARTPQHPLLQLQDKAGNARVTTALAQHGHQVQRAPDTATAYAPLKSGNIEFTNLKHTDQKYRDKAVRIIGLLQKHDAVNQYIAGRPCRITLAVRTTETPADVVDRGASGVDITMASYYFEKYDIGYIMGMLSHEIALHPLASRVPGLHEEEAAFEGFPMLVPGLSGQNPPRTMNTASAGQADHIMGASPDRKRYQTYRDVALRMGELLAQEALHHEEGAKPKDVTDLIDCFLMDVATIAATNDHRAAGVTQAPTVAKVYNAYKALIRDGLAENSPVKPLLPADKGTFGVLRDFSGLAASIASGNRGDSIQNTGGN